MKSFSVFCLIACALAAVVGPVRCEPADDDAGGGAPVADKPQTNRRSFVEYPHHFGGLQHQYAPSYHAHYAPAVATYHGHHAAAHYHGGPVGYAAPAHYHLLHGRGYAPAHYNYLHGHHHVHHETLKPVVYQSVVHTYPTATTVVHKPVPVPVARPVPVEVPRPYPVPVNRPYPVAVIKPVPVPVAQPYPVTVYKPYPVPVYRPLPVAVQTRPVVHYAIRAPPAFRVGLPVRPAYPVAAQPSYVQQHHSYAPAYAAPPNYHPYAAVPNYPAAPAPAHYPAPAYPADAPAPASYLQQLAAVRAAAAAATVGTVGEYEVNEAAHQQTLFQDEYQQQQPQDISITTDVRHHHHDDGDDFHHHGGVQYDQNGDIASGYPSLTTDETFKTSLGVPNTDYTGKKK